MLTSETSTTSTTRLDEIPSSPVKVSILPVSVPQGPEERIPRLSLGGIEELRQNRTSSICRTIQSYRDIEFLESVLNETGTIRHPGDHLHERHSLRNMGHFGRPDLQPDDQDP